MPRVAQLVCVWPIGKGGVGTWLSSPFERSRRNNRVYTEEKVGVAGMGKICGELRVKTRRWRGKKYVCRIRLLMSYNHNLMSGVIFGGLRIWDAFQTPGYSFVALEMRVHGSPSYTISRVTSPPAALLDQTSALKKGTRWHRNGSRYDIHVRKYAHDSSMARYNE